MERRHLVRQGFTSQVRSRRAPWLLLLILLAAVLAGACAEDEAEALPEATSLVGVQNDIPKSFVTGLGWQLCYSDDYGTGGPTVSSILTQCNGPQLMLACAVLNGSILQVLAAGPREDVTFPTPGTTETHVANDVAWYFDTNSAWGFAVPGDGVNKVQPCDDATGSFPGKRMCWETDGGNLFPGRTCGATITSSATHDRLIYQHF